MEEQQPNNNASRANSAEGAPIAGQSDMQQRAEEARPVAPRAVPPQADARVETRRPADANTAGVASTGVPMAVETPEAKLDLRDAFSYLDMVKTRFADNPSVYNHFLKIMRDFKAQTIDTQQVTQQVAQLFKGHRELIEGFNTFLPRTHKIREGGEVPAGASPRPPALQPGFTARPLRAREYGPNEGVRMQTNDEANAVGVRQQTPTSSVHSPAVSSPAMQSPNVTMTLPQPVAGRKTSAEFTHAVTYVKKIKGRFAGEPDVYKQFLEILHTYQKENKSIKEVYVQVAQLFRDHADLLEEFHQFLPDPTQAPRIDAVAPAPLPPLRTGMPGRPRQAPKRTAAALGAAAISKKLRVDEEMREPNGDELEFFKRVRSALDDKRLYDEFLQCMNMFSQDLLRVGELVRMLQGVLGKHPELLQWVKKYLNFREPAMGRERKEAGALDLGACRRLGSYRFLPRSHPLPLCSGRTPLCREVLTDRMISCPSFTSEDNTFVASKKNLHEEAMFRCEDERFELDMLIDLNQATIHALEPIHQKLLAMPEEDAATFSLGSNLGGTTEVLYEKAIRRVYGEKAREAVEGLKRNTAVALPIVLKRLQQKDEEWRAAQREWTRLWREVHLRNATRALDYQTLAFKLNDKKNISAKSLVGEIELALMDQRREKGEKTNGEKVSLSQTMSSQQIDVAHQTFAMQDTEVKQICHRLILHYVRRAPLAPAERKAACKFVNGLLPDFFQYPAAVLSDDYADSSEDESIEFLPMTAAPRGNVLFANGQVYVFFRLFQILYSRIAQMKTVSMNLRDATITERLNPIALQLDAQRSVNEAINGKDLFSTLIDLILKLLDGSVDATAFEDRLWFMFGTEAFVVSTIDKVVHATVKHVLAILGDSVCENLLRLFDSGMRQKALPEFSLKVAAEAIIGARENTFRLHYDGQLQVTLLDRHVDTVGYCGSVEESWSAYVDNFVRIDGESFARPKNPLFLQRVLKRADKESSAVVVSYNLECKICINTYKMFFVHNSEDLILKKFRKGVAPSGTVLKKFKIRRHGRFFFTDLLA